MSIIDINSMTPSGIVAQYVIELLGTGHFLSRDDYTRLEGWLKISQSTDDLLLILDEVLPLRIEKSRESGKKVISLSSVHKTVEKLLYEQRALVGGRGLGVE